MTRRAALALLGFSPFAHLVPADEQEFRVKIAQTTPTPITIVGLDQDHNEVTERVNWDGTGIVEIGVPSAPLARIQITMTGGNAASGWIRCGV